MLRALGEFNGRGSGTHLLTGFEAQLNEHAAARLEEYTGRPRGRLARVLPGLRGGYPGRPLPPNRPALCFYVVHTRLACRRCQLAASGPSGPDALILPGWTPLACHRHRRWLGRDHEPAQHDLSAAPATNAGSIASAIVAFPAAAALTAIITDLSLRRHVALEWDIQPLYQLIDASHGERAAGLELQRPGPQVGTRTPPQVQGAPLLVLADAAPATRALQVSRARLPDYRAPALASGSGATAGVAIMPAAAADMAAVVAFEAATFS